MGIHSSDFSARTRLWLRCRDTPESLTSDTIREVNGSRKKGQKSNHLTGKGSERMAGRSEVSTMRDLKLAITDSTTLPRDKERGLSLIELREPQWSLGDLVLANSTRELLSRIVEENRRSQLIRSHGLLADP